MLVASKKLLVTSVFFLVIACSESSETDVAESAVAPTTTVAPRPIAPNSVTPPTSVANLMHLVQ